MIMKGKTKEVFEHLLSIKSGYENTFIELSNRHNRSLHQFNSNQISKELFDIDVSKINRALLSEFDSIVQEIEGYKALEKKSSLESKFEVHLELNEEFDSFDSEEEKRFLNMLKSLLHYKGEITIKKKYKGSIHLIFDLAPEDAEKLLELYRLGKLTVFGISFVEINRKSGGSEGSIGSGDKKSRRSSQNASNEKEEETVTVILEHAKNLRAMGRFDMAIEHLEEGVSKHPKDDELLYQLANYYRRRSRKDLSDAARLLKKAIKVNPKPVKYYNELGLVYNWVGDFENAIQTLRTALRVNPRSTLAFRLLTETYFQNGQILKALDTVNQGLKHGSKNTYLLEMKDMIVHKTRELILHIEVEQLLSESRIDEALETLENFFRHADDEDELLEEVTSLKNQLIDINFKYRGGVLTSDEANFYKSRIIEAILNLLKES